MIITKIPSSFKYFIVCENQLNPTKELLQILFQDSSLRKQEQKPKKEQKTLLLLPISINIRKISKKATLDLACIIIATGHWTKECRNRKAANEKYTGRKGEALIGAVSVEYNLKTSSDAWIGVQMNTCQIVASGSRHIKNSIQQRILRQAMENIFKQLDQEISTFLFSMEKSGCESISVMFFTYQKFQLFSAGAVLEENKNGNIIAMNIFFKDQKRRLHHRENAQTTIPKKRYKI